MVKTIKALIVSIPFVLLTLLSVIQLASTDPTIFIIVLLAWFFIGALVGYVFAMEEFKIYEKGPIIGACVFSSLNLLVALFHINTQSILALLIHGYLNAPFWWIRLYISSPSYDVYFYIYILCGMLIWGVVGAAIGHIIQNMHEGEW